MTDDYKYDLSFLHICSALPLGDGGLVHHIDADPDSLYIGMPIQAVLKPKAEREGSILDIEGFKPVE